MRKRHTVLKRLIFCFLVFCLLSAGVIGGMWMYRTYSQYSQQLEGLKEYFPPVATSVYALDDTLIARFFQQDRLFIPLHDIPPDLIHAFLAVEDTDFYSHQGIDFNAVLRALYVNVRAGRIQEGGSTITQQLAKVLFLKSEKVFSRKITEVFLAFLIEQKYTKDKILELYLNQIYLGNGAYGVESAARTIFGKKVGDLNLSECSLVAGLASAPNHYLSDIDLALQRRNHVLRRMVEARYISPEQFLSASHTPLLIRSKKRESPAPYFVEYIRQYIDKKYGNDLLYRGGLHVYTTMDRQVQEAAEKAVAEGLEEIDSRRKARGLLRSEEQPVQAALVAIDPHNGFVKAMVGGRDFSGSEFNRAVQAKRPPGSAMKPIIYTAALEQGFTPADIIIDAPFMGEYSPKSDGKWKPKNNGQRFYGYITLRTALEKSINVATIKLVNRIGFEPIISCARRMGISSPLAPVPSLALGSFEVSLLELTSAYSLLANEGVRAEPLFIRSITDHKGNILEKNRVSEHPAVSPQTAYIMTSMLQGVIQRGTGRIAGSLPYPLAAKTGTTNRSADAWFIGYSPDLTAGVWVGFDNNRSLGSRETGSSAAGPIWVKFMAETLRGKKIPDFSLPTGLSFAQIDPKTGLLAEEKATGKFLEVFKEGTEPDRYAPQGVHLSRGDYYLNFIE